VEEVDTKPTSSVIGSWRTRITTIYQVVCAKVSRQV
jgi:hypothetical protein